jgi:hypothetical protein
MPGTSPLKTQWKRLALSQESLHGVDAQSDLNVPAVAWKFSAVAREVSRQDRSTTGWAATGLVGCDEGLE